MTSDKIIQSEEKSGQGSIQILERSKKLELSFAQERLWLLEQSSPDAAANNIPFTIKLTGNLDINVFKKSLNEIVSRHEPLRTSFPVVDNQTIQHITAELELEVPVIDLSNLGSKEKTQKIDEYIHKEAEGSFDLANGPVIRACLLFIGNDEHLLLLTVHHIAADGRSMEILFNELTALYKAFSQGEQSPLMPLAV